MLIIIYQFNMNLFNISKFINFMPFELSDINIQIEVCEGKKIRNKVLFQIIYQIKETIIYQDYV